jgi:hypothetical protein
MRSRVFELVRVKVFNDSLPNVLAFLRRPLPSAGQVFLPQVLKLIFGLQPSFSRKVNPERAELILAVLFLARTFQ